MDGPIAQRADEAPLPVPPEVGVADGDECVREGLCALLETCGLAVEAYPDAEALAGREEDLPGCLILDVELPGILPSELPERIRRLAARTRVIVTAVCPDARFLADLLRSGAMDVLEKPFAPDRLIGQVRKALGRGVRAVP